MASLERVLAVSCTFQYFQVHFLFFYSYVSVGNVLYCSLGKMFLEHKGKKITQVFTSETFNTLHRLKTQANKTTLMS